VGQRRRFDDAGCFVPAGVKSPRSVYRFSHVEMIGSLWHSVEDAKRAGGANDSDCLRLASEGWWVGKTYR
jgi:hypothetical protein